MLQLESIKPNHVEGVVPITGYSDPSDYSDSSFSDSASDGDYDSGEDKSNKRSTNSQPKLKRANSQPLSPYIARMKEKQQVWL